MKICKNASAGTLESSDVLVEVRPGRGSVELAVDSVVAAQYGAAIEASVQEVLHSLGVENVQIHLSDRGALDCVIRARVETALRRGSEAEK